MSKVGQFMTRLSEAYWRAVRAVEKRDVIRATLKHQHAHEKHIRTRGRRTLKESDKVMKDLRRPPDTPPWEKE